MGSVLQPDANTLLPRTVGHHWCQKVNETRIPAIQNTTTFEVKLKYSCKAPVELQLACSLFTLPLPTYPPAGHCKMSYSFWAPPLPKHLVNCCLKLLVVFFFCPTTPLDYTISHPTAHVGPKVIAGKVDICLRDHCIPATTVSLWLKVGLAILL